MNLIDKHWVDYSTKVNRGDDAYGRNDTIEAVIFQEGMASDGFAEKYLDFVDLDEEMKKRAMAYALSRIASIYKLWDEDLYNADIRKGYYGEEVAGITHTHENKINSLIHKCESLVHGGEIRKMIFKLLREEYGFILDHIENATLSEDWVNISELQTPNKHYAKKTNPNDYYVNSEIPIGIYFDKEVVDGYNRLATLKAHPDINHAHIYNFTS